MKKYLFRIPLFLCFLCGIVLSLKTLREPDLWWQIRTGEWIIANSQVPATDIFSYTFEGAPWVNIKWGFEVIAALISSSLGPENVFLLQALVTIALLYFLVRTAREWTSDTSYSERRDALLPVALLVLIVGIAYRIIGRPEMISHLFSVIFLFILLRHRTKPGQLIFGLIPLQALWANLHEAFALGLVLTWIFAICGWIEHYLGQQKKILFTTTRPVQLSLTALACTAAIIFNPYGTALFHSPLNIFGQVFENKYTTELLGIDSPMYWQKEAWIAIGMLATALAGFIVPSAGRKSPRKWHQRIIDRHGLLPFVLLAAFTYLATTAYRNIAFLDLIVFPFFVNGLVQIAGFASGKKWFTRIVPSAMIVSAAAGVLLYVSVVSDKYYRFTNSNDYYGLQVLSVNNPAGAADYIASRGLGPKRAFSDYLTSSYLLWKLQPSFKTFIDLRDLDVFPDSFFQTFARAAAMPESFRQADSQYRFDYVVLFRPQFMGLHYHLFHDSTYSLRYLDAVAAVYEKHPVKSNTIAFTASQELPRSGLALGISRAFNPFHKGYDYSAINTEAEAASYFMNINQREIARDYALRALQQPGPRFRALDLLGELYYEQAASDTNPSTRQMLSDSAMLLFNAAYKENPEFAPVLMDLGAVSFRRSQMKQAVKFFEAAVDVDPMNVNAHMYAGEAYKNLANQGGAMSAKYTKLAIGHLTSALALDPTNVMTQASIGFLYYNLKDCDKVNEYLGPIRNSEMLPEKERKGADGCLKSCGY